MKKVDLSKVKEAGSGSYKRLPVGGYVLRILKVVDVPEYNRLDFYYDIAEGEYKDYYNERIRQIQMRIRSGAVDSLSLMMRITNAPSRSLSSL